MFGVEQVGTCKVMLKKSAQKKKGLAVRKEIKPILRSYIMVN